MKRQCALLFCGGEREPLPNAFILPCSGILPHPALMARLREHQCPPREEVVLKQHSYLILRSRSVRGKKNCAIPKSEVTLQRLTLPVSIEPNEQSISIEIIKSKPVLFLQALSSR